MPKLPDRALVAVVLALTALIYVKTLGNGYTYDDRQFAMAPNGSGAANEMVATLQPLPDYFTSHYGQGVARGRGLRPVTVLSFAGVHALFGGPATKENGACPAWPHHLLNVLLHVVATLLAYLLVRPFTRHGVTACAAAAVFGLHAIRSDAVIAIVGRAEILAFVFGATACLGYLRTCAGRMLWAAPTAALLFLAFCSKESALAWAAALPLFALAHGWTKHSALPGACLRSQSVPFALTVLPAALLFLGLFFNLQDSLAHAAETGQTPSFFVSELDNPLYRLAWFERLPAALMVWGYGLGKTLLPLHLACDYGAAVFEIPTSLLDLRVLLAVAALGSCLWGGLRRPRRQPLLFLAVVMFFGFGLLTSNLLLPIETIFGERLYYTPALALSMVVAWAAQQLDTGRLRTIAISALSVWLVGTASVCVLRTFHWHSNETLLDHDSGSQPRSVAIRSALAQRYRRSRDQAKATEERQRFERAWQDSLLRITELTPNNPQPLNDLAALRRSQGRLQEAVELLQRAVALTNSTDVPSRMRAHFQLGMLAQDSGDANQAFQQYQRCLELAPAAKGGLAQHARSRMIGILDARLRDPGLHPNTRRQVLLMRRQLQR